MIFLKQTINRLAVYEHRLWIQAGDAVDLVEMFVGGDGVGELVGVHDGRVEDVARFDTVGGVLREEGNGCLHILNRHRQDNWH